MKNYDYEIKIRYTNVGFIEVTIHEYNGSKERNSQVAYTDSVAFVDGKFLNIFRLVSNLNLDKVLNKSIPKNSKIKISTRLDIESYHSAAYKAEVDKLISDLIIYLSSHPFYESDDEKILFADEKEALLIVDLIERLYKLYRLKINVIPMYEIDPKNRYYLTGSLDGFKNGNITISKVVSYDEDNMKLEDGIGNIAVKLISFDDEYDGDIHCNGANIFQCKTVLFESTKELISTLSAIVEEGENRVILAASTTLEGKINQYTKYIQDHCDRVILGFNKYGNALCKVVGADYGKVYNNIQLHDASKTTSEEFDAYRVKFYPVDGETYGLKEELNFQKAWLHHIHNNPHHPEYWILTGTDDGIDKVLDMEPEYIVEMLLDWDTFKKDGKGGAYDYYFVQGHKKEGLLSDTTRMLVEKGLQVLK